MMDKSPLCPARVRKITGSCAFLAHRFVRDGFWTSRSHPEVLLSVLLGLVADRNGLAYDGCDKICGLLQRSLAAYLLARNALIQQDLRAFDGHLWQGRSRPPHRGRHPAAPRRDAQQMAQAEPATIRPRIRNSLGAAHA